MPAQQLAVAVDPFVQPGPYGDQRLVGEVDGVVVEGDQPGPGQPVQDDGRVAGAVGVEFGATGGTAGVVAVLARDDQPQHHSAGEPGLLRRKAAVEVLGGLGDRTPDAAGGLVPLEAQRAAAAAVPGLQERVGHQGKAAGLIGDVLDDPVGQGPFNGQAVGRGGFDDGLAQFVRAHGGDEQARTAQSGREAAVFAESAVEVRACRDHHPQPAVGPGACQQPVEETGALGGVLAEREDLLELVHDDPRLSVPRGLGGGERSGVGAGRMLAGGENAYGRRAGARPGVAAQRRDQSGS